MSKESFSTNFQNKILEKQFQKLNDVQKEAVTYFDSALLILAGAGSGKTTVIVNKIAWLLNSNFVNDKNSIFFNLKPWQILAITFTNKAANELCDRLKLILNSDANLINAGTFHSQCVKILIKHINLLGFNNSFTIYDTQDAQKIFKKEIFKKLNINSTVFQPKTVLYEISKAKNSFLSPDEYAEKFNYDFYKTEVSKIYKLYQTYLKNANALDFDDIIFLTVKLLKTYPEILEIYQNKFKYVLIDEYQDTNFVQFELVKLLTKKNLNLCVVGDDDQSIYRFRGAVVENILNFDKQLKNVKIIRLEQNYRSTQNILSSANFLISNNMFRKEKRIWTDKGDGEKINQIQLDNENEEADFICNEIENNLKNGFKYSDHAIFYRMNAQSANIEKFLIRHSIPYQIIGAKKFYELKEIKDLIAYLTVLNNPHDNLRLIRIINEPKRGIGNSTILKLQNLSIELNQSIYEILSKIDELNTLKIKSKPLKSFYNLLKQLMTKVGMLPLPDLFEEILFTTGYFETLKKDEKFEQRMENLKELKTNLMQFENENAEIGQINLANFLSEVALYTDLNELNSNIDRVNLMTLHSAKGLEFPVVFMTGMEEGVFPSGQAIQSQNELEEERRLAYVGITRAKQKLYLTYVNQRLIFGSTQRFKPSQFLNEIPDKFKQIKNITEINNIKNFNFNNANKFNTNKFFKCDLNKQTQVNLKNINFFKNDMVKHPIFGQGIVVSVLPMGNDNLIEINFNKTGLKKVMANYAKLEKIN